MKPNTNKKAQLLGIGFDADDGHKRITRGENFTIAGGSEETHDHMAETAVKFNENLRRKCKSLNDVSREEFIDMIREASEH
ncbi:MAG: hypothetical protein IKB71_08350 [Lentisphaeria bacterium]|nr:hypothetical protein [Lentisphaeria bacterium]